MERQKRLITSALPYTNNVPHIGNIVGSHYPADVFARYCRLAGHDTVFIGGTDEHGTATEITAQKYGVTPKELCDFFYDIHKDIYDWFQISYDNFSRTSKEIHYETTTEFLGQVYDNGFIIPQDISLPFCKSCDRQLADRFIEGECPYCKYEKARGDQCEHCGKVLDPEKLVHPYCTVCNSRDIEFKTVKHLFLDLEKLSPQLQAWIESKEHWRPQVRNLALSWINEGLKPRCITRELKWGVPVPFEGFEDLVFYVWVDAPIGYISSTKEWDPKRWQEFWKSKDSKIYHFIGKDNIPFHTIFFPGMLMANSEYTLPHNVVGLQYLNYEGSKFSKSKGYGIFCENLPEAGLPVDYWRFYLAYLIPETRDTEFFWKDFQDRVNSELVGNFGNFVNRTLTFTKNKFMLEVPKPHLTKKDTDFIEEIGGQVDRIGSSFEDVKLREALEGILKLSDMGNRYFQENEPWKDVERAKSVVFVCVNLCRVLGLLMRPFLPLSAFKLETLLNVHDKDWSKLNEFTLKVGHKMNEPKLLFEKLEDAKVEELKQKTSKVTEYFKEAEPEPVKEEESPAAPMEKEAEEMEKAVEASGETVVEEEAAEEEIDYVPFEEWKKLKLKVGKVIKASDHPDADKLYVLLVDVGEDAPIQLVAGIKKEYTPQELVGKKITVIINLQPATIRGVRSDGMLLAAEDSDGIVRLLIPDGDLKDGANIC